MTSLLNDEKCVKMLAVYVRFCTQAYGDLFSGVVPTEWVILLHTHFNFNTRWNHTLYLDEMKAILVNNHNDSQMKEIVLSVCHFCIIYTRIHLHIHINTCTTFINKQHTNIWIHKYSFLLSKAQTSICYFIGDVMQHQLHIRDVSQKLLPCQANTEFIQRGSPETICYTFRLQREEKNTSILNVIAYRHSRLALLVAKGILSHSNACICVHTTYSYLVIGGPDKGPLRERDAATNLRLHLYSAWKPSTSMHTCSNTKKCHEKVLCYKNAQVWCMQTCQFCLQWIAF